TVPMDDSIRNANKVLIMKLKIIAEQERDSISAFYVDLFEKGIYIRGAKNPVEVDKRRDCAMAENIVWMQEHLVPEGNSVVWAHNGHIAKAKLNTIYKMGYYLKQHYGDN